MIQLISSLEERYSMGKKKKIALIVDVNNWTLFNIANNIKNSLSEYYEIDVYSATIFDGNMVKMFLLCRDYDLIHFLWRGLLSLIDTDTFNYQASNLFFERNEFIQKFIKSKKITTAVCDHLYLNSEEFEITKSLLKYVDNYFVISKKIFDIYSNLEGIKKPYGIIHDSVDLNLYRPSNLERFNNIQKLYVGWVGNSKFTDSDKDSDLKGVNNIIKPAINELIESGYNIEMKFADRNERLIPQSQMPEYYNQIHLYVCASKTEGTPMPLLESMACGVPIISTDVGIAREAFGQKQQEFILKERTKDALKQSIIKLIENKEKLKELSIENISHVKNWSCEKNAIEYKKFFDANL